MSVSFCILRLVCLCVFLFGYICAKWTIYIYYIQNWKKSTNHDYTWNNNKNSPKRGL